MSQPDIKHIKTTFIHPATKQPANTIPLSILDALATSYTSTAAVWFFDANNTTNDFENTDLLQKSLSATLSDFPHFAGDLRKIENVPVPGSDEYNDHTKRYGRLLVTFGADTDPGVGFYTASCEHSLDEIVPSLNQRNESESTSWNSFCPANRFVPDASVAALGSGSRSKASSPVLIQITHFKCGSVSIGVKIAHPLADAHTFSVFMHRWSYEHSLLCHDQGHTTAPRTPNGYSIDKPQFDPQLLDSRAAGNINAACPDESILTLSRSLPSSRYDWFWPADADTKDQEPDPYRNLPAGITRSMIKSPGEPMPKPAWDPRVPVSDVKFHFSAKQIQKIWESAGATGSRHDAIVAHVWSAISRARGLGEDDGDVSLYYTFGLRKRLGLSSQHLGSPVLLTTVRMPGCEASPSNIQNTASKIRNNLNLYTKEALEARLHDLCYEVSPQRFWQVYLGPRHVSFTSWAHLELYDLDLGFGKARYVKPVMPLVDGLFYLMEGRPKSGEEKKHWCDDGVDVAVSIASGAVQRLKDDTAFFS